MATPATPTGQRRLIIGLVVLVVILLIALAFFVALALSRKPNNSTSVAVVGSPSPSAAASPSPGPPSGHSTVGQVLTAAGTLLQSGSGSDAADGRGNGGSCKIWTDPGWTSGDCNQVPMNGKDNQAQYVSYVTEHKPGPGGVQWRVFLMTTTATEAFWHTRLYFGDEQGGGFTNITVLSIDTTGGGAPDLVVGFRHNKTSGSGTVLDYDILQRASATAPLHVVAHRQLADGAVVFGPGVTDYDSSPGPQFTKSVIGLSGGSFRITSTSQVPPSSVPAGQLP